MKDHLYLDSYCGFLHYKIYCHEWLGCKKRKKECELALSQWFRGLSEKTQLAIYYSQRAMRIEERKKRGDKTEVDIRNECPWLTEKVWKEQRITRKYILSGGCMEIITQKIDYG